MPRSERPPSDAPTRHAPATRRNGTPARILLAEDDFEMRDLIASALRRDGYDVVDVADGGRLLVQIAETYVRGTPYDAFDLVVSDIRMPVCSGLQIVEELRRARWQAPVILMTAFGDEATRHRAEMLGAVLFDKPFDVDDLRTAVLNLVVQDTRRTSRPPVAGPAADTGHPLVLTVVGVFDHPDEALIAKGRLERAGVHVCVTGPRREGSAQKDGTLGELSLFVRGPDVERAKAILWSYATHRSS